MAKRHEFAIGARKGICRECGRKRAHPFHRTAAKRVPSLPPLPRKAQDFQRAVEEAEGWSLERIDKGTVVTLQASRGGERVTLSWDDGVAARPLGSYCNGEQEHKIKNVTVGIRLLAVSESVASANACTRKGGKMAKVPHVPFSAASSTDEEVIAAVSGKTITWLNRLSQEVEEGTVPKKGKHTKVTLMDLDDPSTRQLTFCSVGVGGFRTIRLDSVLEVK